MRQTVSIRTPARAQRGIRALRQQAALFERWRGFDRSMRRLEPGPDGTLPFAAVTELFAHWGDPLDQAGEAYLRSCLAEAVRARGPIVQCGASVLTLALGRLCSAGDDRSRQIWCLEQAPHWASVVRSWLTQYQVTNAHVIASRPHLFDGYVWFAVDVTRLASQVSLVLCEGARATPHGIIGTLERLGGRLAPDFTALARGIHRAEDLKALSAWARGSGAACVVVDRQQGFVKLTRNRASAAASA